MTVKVLVTALGQQIVAGVKQIENKETSEIVGYWLSQPRIVSYTKDEDDNIGINFLAYCLISDEAEFSLRADHVVAILEPRQSVADGYTKLVYPENLEDGTDTTDTEGSDSVNSTDGTVSGGAEGTPEGTDASVGQDEAVPAAVA